MASRRQLPHSTASAERAQAANVDRGAPAARAKSQQRLLPPGKNLDDPNPNKWDGRKKLAARQAPGGVCPRQNAAQDGGKVAAHAQRRR